MPSTVTSVSARVLGRSAARHRRASDPPRSAAEPTRADRTEAHVAVDDCERCRPGLVAQPVNTVSSLAFVVSGWLAIRAARRHPATGTPTTDAAQAAVGWAAIAAGLGSVAYHGPGTAVGRYLHDASLLGLLGTIVVADTAIVAGRTPPTAVLAAVAPVAIAAAHPRSSTGAQALLGTAATVAEGTRFAVRPARGPARHRRRIEAIVTGVGATAHALGRSGGPLCDPDSRLQPHALWHGAMAFAVWLRARDVGARGATT